MRVAYINSGVVENIVVADSVEHVHGYDDVIELPEDSPVGIGWQYDVASGTFSDPTPPTPTLRINLSASIVQANTPVTADLSVTLPDGSFASVTGTYYVPLLRNDGIQDQLLKVDVVGGQGSVDFSINNPGIYTIKMDQIYPKPTALLAESPVVIVSP